MERGAKHILSSYNVSLTQGRYRWRHYQVLEKLDDIIEKDRKKRAQKKDYKYINFVQEGDPTIGLNPAGQESFLV